MIEKRFWGYFLKCCLTATPALSVLAVRGTWVWTGKLLNCLMKEGQGNSLERKMFSVFHSPAEFSIGTLCFLWESNLTVFNFKKLGFKGTHTLPREFFKDIVILLETSPSATSLLQLLCLQGTKPHHIRRVVCMTVVASCHSYEQYVEQSGWRSRQILPTLPPSWWEPSVVPGWTPAALLSSQWAAAGQMRGSCSAEKCSSCSGLPVENAMGETHAGMIPVLQVFKGCRAFHISCQVNTDICSLNELWDDKFLGCWECANQPWFAWELGRRRAGFWCF